MTENLEEMVKKHEKQIRLLVSNKLQPNGDCLTYKQVSNWLGISVSTVRKYVNIGQLHCFYPNAKKCFRPQDVERFMRGFTPKKQIKLG